METFFWSAFGIFFVIASLIGLFVIVYSIIDRVHTKIVREKNNKKKG